MARTFNDLTQRRRWWSASVQLVLLLAMVALALPCAAQSTMYDLEDAEFDFFGYDGTPTGVLVPYAEVTGGNGTYSLPDGWIVEITHVYSWDQADFRVSRVGQGVIGTDTADISSGISEHMFYDNGGIKLWVVFGTLGNDTILVHRDVEYSLVFGMDGHDNIQGNDQSIGGYGSRDVFFGGGDDDSIDGHQDLDVIFGDWFDDSTWSGDDFLKGGDENDWIYTGAASSVDYAYGEEGDDWLMGGNGTQDLYGGNGSDHMEGGGDEDFMWGEDSCDDMWGDAGPILDEAINAGVYGSWAPAMSGWTDVMYGGTGDDFMRGQEGDDELYGQSENDCLDGGSGADWLEGGSGDDYLHDMDGTGGDTLLGGTEHDKIHCCDVDDADDYDGGTGNDYLWVDSGDTPLASSGTDTFNHLWWNAPGGYAAAGTYDAFENYARNTHWGGGRSC